METAKSRQQQDDAKKDLPDANTDLRSPITPPPRTLSSISHFSSDSSRSSTDSPQPIQMSSPIAIGKKWYEETDWYLRMMMDYSVELSSAEELARNSGDEAKLTKEHLSAKQGTYWRRVKFLQRHLDAMAPDISDPDLSPSTIIARVVNYFADQVRSREDEPHSLKDLTASLKLIQSQNSRLKMENSQLSESRRLTESQNVKLRMQHSHLSESRVSLDDSAELTQSVLSENDRLLRQEKASRLAEQKATTALADLQLLHQSLDAAYQQSQQRVAHLQEENRKQADKISTQETLLAELFEDAQNLPDKKEDSQEQKQHIEQKEKELKESAAREEEWQRKIRALEEQNASLTAAQQRFQEQIEEAQTKLATETRTCQSASTMLINSKMQIAQLQRQMDLTILNGLAANWHEAGMFSLVAGGSIDLITVLAATGTISLGLSTLGIGLLIAAGTTLILFGLFCLYQSRKKSNAATTLESTTIPQCNIKITPATETTSPPPYEGGAEEAKRDSQSSSSSLTLFSTSSSSTANLESISLSNIHSISPPPIETVTRKRTNTGN